MTCAQFLSRGEVFNFEPGDLFQSKSWSYGLTPSGPPTYRTDSVISKAWSGSDSVIYQFHRQTYQPPASLGLPAFLHDTLVTIAYGDLSLPAAHYGLPWPCPPVLDTMGASPQYCGRMAWVRYTSGDTCFEPDTWTSILIAGCGGPYYSSLQPAGPLHLVHELAYFRKDGEECGELITGIRKAALPFSPHFLHPNPGTTGFTLSGLRQGRAELRLLDMQGRVVLGNRSVQDGELVGTHDLAAGSYVVELRTNEGQVHRLRWVKR